MSNTQKIRKYARLLILLTLAFVVTGCTSQSSKPTPESWRADDRYISGLGNFSCRIPAMKQPGARTRQRFDADSAEVMFSDDFGGLLRIESERWSSELMPLIQPIRLHATLDDIFDKTIFNDLFRTVSPDAKALHREHVVTAAAPALFATVEIPGGSTLVDATTKRRLDSVRGVMVFFKNGFLYVVSNQDRRYGSNAFAMNAQDRDVRLLNDLQECIAEMKFN